MSSFDSDSISMKFTGGVAIFSERSHHHASRFSDFFRQSSCGIKRNTLPSSTTKILPPERAIPLIALNLRGF